MAEPTARIKLERKTIEFSAAVLVSFLCVCLLLLRSDPFTVNEFGSSPRSDHVYYLQLAVGGPQSCHEAPYCWRVLQPMLASMMPFDVQSNFLLITVLSVWLTGLALYYLLRTYDIPAGFCLSGVILFYSLGWATGFLFFYFWLNEGLAFLIITLAIYFIRVRRYVCVLALLTLGVAAKEAVLAVVPVYYTLTVSPRRPRDLFCPKLAAKTILLAIPASGMLYLIHRLIPVTNQYDLAQVFAHYLQARSQGTVPLPLIIAPPVHRSLASAFLLGNVATYGVVLALPFFDVGRNLQHMVRYFPYLALVNAQILVAEGTERLLVYSFPVVVLMSVYGLMALARWFSLSPLQIMPLPVGWFALTLFGHRWVWTFLPWQAVIFAAYTLMVLGIVWRRIAVERSKRLSTTSGPDTRT